MRSILVFTRQAGSAASLLPFAIRVSQVSNEFESVYLISFVETKVICDEILQDYKGINCIFVKNEKQAQSAYKKIIMKTDFILCGTSPDGIKDKWYWAFANKLKKKLYVYIDQSTHFHARFPRLKPAEYPNKILLNSLDIPNKKELSLYPTIEKIKIGNPSLLNLYKKKLKDKNNVSVKRYVFCTEPAINQDLYKKINGFNDVESFYFFISFLRKNEINSGIYIRLHPRDNSKRWIKILPDDLNIKFDHMEKFASLKNSYIVFGMRSHILLESKILGVKTISLQPNAKTKSYLEDYMTVVKKESDLKAIFKVKSKIKFYEINCAHYKINNLFT